MYACEISNNKFNKKRENTIFSFLIESTETKD